MWVTHDNPIGWFFKSAKKCDLGNLVLVYNQKLHCYGLHYALWKFRVCRLGLTFIVFRPPYPLAFLNGPPPMSIFFQNDQLLNIYQEIYTFFLSNEQLQENPLFCKGWGCKNISIPPPKSEKIQYIVNWLKSK